MKLEYKLGRIHCAGCAQALEEILSKVQGVKRVGLNFISNVVTFEIEDKNRRKIEEDIKSAILKFDRHIEIMDPHAEEKAEKKEKIKSVFRFVGLGIGLAVMVLLMVFNWNFYLELGLALFAYLLVGHGVLFSAFSNILRGKIFDENFLMSIATIGAFVLGEFSEAVGVMVFFGIGEIFQNMAVKNSEKSIKKIAGIKESRARLVLDNTEMDVTLEKVSVGDFVRVNAGEKVPLDGKIVEGESYVNLSVLTGESKEKFMRVNDEILSGSIPTTASLLIEVTKLESESTVSKIIELVEQSSTNKSKTEKFISRFSKWYTPIVVSLALLIAFLVPAFSGYQNFAVWAYRALVFLVVSCPCALVISVPLTFFAGIGAMARNGVLVKGAGFLEKLANADTFIFDKTGTLTHGEFVVSKIHAEEEKTSEEILEFVAYAEAFSNHRIAKSIVEEYKRTTKNVIDSKWINGMIEIAGEGVQANIFGIDCLVGNAKLLESNDVVFEEFKTPNTVVYLAQNGTYAGFIEIKDRVREESTGAIALLRENGAKHIAMFTGDTADVAKVVASELEMDSFHANLLPADKVEKLNNMSRHGQKISFVGDGINDAPILSCVDVGIAMGGVGSDIAIESADVVIVNDDLLKIPFASLLSKRTKNIVIQNIVLSIGIKIGVLILATLGLSNMWLGIFADVGVALLAILNAMRALIVTKKIKRKLDKKQ